MAEVDKLKVAIYTRVSTQWQVDKDSLQVQKRELIGYADMVLGIKDYVVFVDPGYSAKNTDRPDYQAMMARLRTGEFSHLLVWKLDRISRNLLDFATMYAELKSLGITFVSKNEQFDTSTAIGEAMLKIILVFAELERKMTAERVTAVMLSRANNGQWNGGQIPFGYNYDKVTKTFSVNENERQIYERILDLYEKNQSLVYVCRYLNEKGFLTKRGKPWSPAGVHTILRNVWYTGAYRYNVHSESAGYTKRDAKEWILIGDHHDALIDKDRFDNIQSMLERNVRGEFACGKTYEKKNVHIFAGLVKCGICGANMSATIDRRRASGWRPSIYGCSTRRNNNAKCNNKYVSDALIGPFVFNFIANMVRARSKVSKRTTISQLQAKLLKGEAFAAVKSIDEGSLRELLDLLLSGVSGVEYRPRNMDSAVSPCESEINLLRDRKRRNESALNRLKSLFLFSDSGMPEKDYIAERQRIMLDIETIDKRLNELSAASTSGMGDPEELVEKASYFIMADKLLGDGYIDYGKYITRIDPKIPRAFIRVTVKEIVVTGGKVHSIEFKSGIKFNFKY